jgi:2-polyprenyl-6-methoxyphenol hydroxylase-like FAD-dependent oxidoreductase
MRLTENACPVVWETRLVELQQDDQGATVALEQNGAVQHWRCRWVVGADGANSTVRRSLGIAFEGRSHAGRFFLADVHIPDAHHRNIHFSLSKQGTLGVFPFDTRGHYRLVGRLPKGWKTKTELRYAHIKPFVDNALNMELQVDRCTWVNEFMPGRLMAEQFARQRCLLIGDAAHVYSPIGGQGMDTGIQDAINLAWKLAGVISGRTPASLLNTYQQERMPVARGEFRVVDRVFERAIRLPKWLKPFRDMLLTKLLRHVSTEPTRLRAVFAQLAQLNVHYREGGLAVHHAMGMRVRAGDRLPFLPVFNEKTKAQTDLHRWCEKPGFVLLVLGTISHHHLHIIGQWMRQKYPRHMHLYYLPYSPRNQLVFDLFEVKPEGTKSILVRPDMHIGYINDMLNVSLIDTYMEEIVGWKYFGYLPENA